MGFLVKIHSTCYFLPTNNHIRGFSVLKAHFAGVREKLDIWAKSSLCAHLPPKNSPFPNPTADCFNSLASSQKCFSSKSKLALQVPSHLWVPKFKIHKEELSVLSPHLARKPWSPFSQSLRLLSCDLFLRIHRNHSGLVAWVSSCMSRQKTENKEMM